MTYKYVIFFLQVQSGDKMFTIYVAFGYNFTQLPVKKRFIVVNLTEISHSRIFPMLRPEIISK